MSTRKTKLWRLITTCNFKLQGLSLFCKGQVFWVMIGCCVTWTTLSSFLQRYIDLSQELQTNVLGDVYPNTLGKPNISKWWSLKFSCCFCRNDEETEAWTRLLNLSKYPQVCSPLHADQSAFTNSQYVFLKKFCFLASCMSNTGGVEGCRWVVPVMLESRERNWISQFWDSEELEHHVTIKTMNIIDSRIFVYHGPLFLWHLIVYVRAVQTGWCLLVEAVLW